MLTHLKTVEFVERDTSWVYHNVSKIEFTDQYVVLYIAREYTDDDRVVHYQPANRQFSVTTKIPRK